MVTKATFTAGKVLRHLPLEACCWFAALVALALTDPASSHFSLCPLKNAGITFCPGCGLGRSITLFFHGDIAASFHTHPLGIFAVIVLSFRIVNLTKHYLKHGKSY